MGYWPSFLCTQKHRNNNIRAEFLFFSSTPCSSHPYGSSLHIIPALLRVVGSPPHSTVKGHVPPTILPLNCCEMWN